MFSPSLNEGGPATATRSRRRQRPLSSESLVQQPKAKRQRQRLTELTFVNPGAAQPDMYEVKATDSIAKLPPRHDGIENAPGPKKELSVRSKKPKAGERLAKGDGTVVLVRVPSSGDNSGAALARCGAVLTYLWIDDQQRFHREQAASPAG